jgi:hypothetical protein
MAICDSLNFGALHGNARLVGLKNITAQQRELRACRPE